MKVTTLICEDHFQDKQKGTSRHDRLCEYIKASWKDKSKSSFEVYMNHF